MCTDMSQVGNRVTCVQQHKQPQRRTKRLNSFIAFFRGNLHSLGNTFRIEQLFYVIVNQLLATQFCPMME